MSIEKELTKRMDERGNHYNGIAARMAYIANGVVGLIITIFYMYKALSTGDQGYLDLSLLFMLPAITGGIVYSLLLVKWKVGDKK